MATNKLSAKAARLDFSSLPGVPAPVAPGNEPSTAAAPPAAARAATAPEPGALRPKTAPGAMMAFAHDARSELVRENEALKQRAAQADALKGRLDEALGDLRQWEGAKAARQIDPASVRPSRFANRHERSYTEESFQRLKAEIENAGGNVQPIKVRSLPASEADGAQYELVFGHRRHRACLELGLPVLAVVDNLDDRALFVEMDRENRARKDLSAWEQGMMYRRALHQGLFPSNRKLAEAIGVDLSALGKALALAELPEEVVAAFASPLDLQFRWAKPLGDALGRDRLGVLALARRLADGPADRRAREVFEQLSVVGLPGVEPFHPPKTRDLLVGDRLVGSLQLDERKGLTLCVGAGALSDGDIDALAELVSNFVQQRVRSGT